MRTVAARKRRTKRDQDAKATRRDVLWAAVNILARDGEHGVTMVAVAKQAKRSRGTVYHHFEDREHLLRCMREELQGQLSEIASGTQTPADPFSFNAELARHAPDLARTESLNLVRQGRAHPHISGLISALREGRRGKTPEALLHRDVDLEAAATLFIVCTWIAPDIYLNGVSGESERERAAKNFTRTLKHLLFHGLLDETNRQSIQDSLGLAPRAGG